MTKLDIAILILIGLAGLSCYRLGFTRSVWGIFSLGAGFWTASYFWQKLAPLFQRIIEEPETAKWVSIVALVVVTAILVDLLFERLRRIFEEGVLGWLNRLLGIGFGIASSVILIAFALMLLKVHGGDAFKTEMEKSRFAPQLVAFGHRVWTASEEQVRRRLETE